MMIDFIFGGAQLTPYSGKMMDNLWVSCLRVLIGFGLAAAAGILLGFLSGRKRFIRRMIDPLIQMIRTVPGIGWLPLALIWFGIGEGTTVFLIALAAFFPIYLNVVDGASSVPESFIRAGQMLGADQMSLFRTVIFPSAFPSMVVGLRLGLGVSWAYLVLGELTGVSLGLGAVLMDSRMLGQVEMIPVTMLVIAVMGFISDRLLIFICRQIYSDYERGAHGN
ncbi:nitrate/sulfonate/bicarbonate ABC transport system permease protein SsuC [Acetobacterium woodii DSM 1030]|uniref:Nitrate/sulfonate/bicarbonate ABC transport system permease protein SsuC n=1 Tax=Acetobacterium woodii (strain ATCC 29683 / DSM 1030 / JCM 2381 / KCTC 1655 / WB1) TaxID=931626 RepID=H6LEV7_ACEWD|nr:nitrate/sulfonate/bicarbonate ABC transport system permease protein SsuC [Acetobacterium woodii DSM 1030]